MQKILKITKARAYIFFVITLLCPVFVCGQGGSSAKVTQIDKVVIDPGHGGKHPGCVYKNFLEKDITLSIGLELGKLIKKNFPGVEVIYTRTTDKYVDLDERGRIANKAAADLFISIHINSAESSAAQGTSTYVMGLDKSGKNLEVAMKENDVVIYEEDYSTKYEGYTPGDPTSYIIFSLMQSAHLEQSMQLAEIVQKHFKQDIPLKDLGARQGPFLVLWDTSMPSILTEVGFLSNSQDRAYITTSKGQNAAARSLFNAFSEYKSRVEGRSSVVLLKDQSAVPDKSSAAKSSTAKSSAKTAQPASGIKFYVQIASLTKPKSLNSADFKSYRGKVVEIKAANGVYKYLVGGYAGFDEADRKLAEVKKEFRDAFVVAFDGSKSLKLDEARRKTK